MSHTGIDGFADDIERQRRYVAPRVPSYDRVLAHVAEALGGDLGRRLGKAWARRRFDIFYERPLLLLATLRHDALAVGPTHPLWAALAAPEPDPDTVTAGAVARSLGREPERARVWHDLTRRRLQTNEVSRAVAWLWPALLAAEAGARAGGGASPPLALVDLGCSAGLNLVADDLGLTWTDPDGAPFPVAQAPRVVRRLGLDQAPLDPCRDDDADWLRACVWAGERDRQERLEQAIAAFRAAHRSGTAPPVLEAIDARDMPARLIELAAAGDTGGDDRGGPMWLAFQTVMREYLGPARAPYMDGMRAFIASRPVGRALWIELEAPAQGASKRFPAALIAHFRSADGGEILDEVVARCEYHPTEIAAEPRGLSLLSRALSA